jgi:23S rRNA (cytosine1962-C5)-methyltransferase
MAPVTERAHVEISGKGVDRLRAGHPWIYRSDITAVTAHPGDCVAVHDHRGRPLGCALYSDRSQIALRMLTRDAEVPPALWHDRLARAIAFRASLGLEATAYRLVHGEADLLPSLVVDRYGDYLVLQALSQGIDRRTAEIVEHLVALVSPRGILARNDAKVRTLEGLPQKVELLHGEVPESVTVREGPVEFLADLWRGQKTGLFLDQRENREAAARYARGRALDAFTYNGGFALRMAPACDSVLALDASEEAVSRVRENARANGASNVEARVANVFDELRELERGGERFDTIVLDPPAFAKSRAALPKALSGYKEINLRALKLLAPGGTLVTCTCSYHVDEATFGHVLYEAATDAHVPVSVVEKRMQGRDHPVLLGVPETYYLKCLVLRRVG